MNTNSLSRLYCQSQTTQARFTRLLAELAPESAALAESVNQSRRHAPHPMRTREIRTAHAARRRQAHPLRWMGGIAAAFALAFGVLGWHGDQRDWSDVAASVHSAPMTDRIFTSQDRIFVASDDARGTSGRQGDQLFHADFAIGG
jgi:hypothetical protein